MRRHADAWNDGSLDDDGVFAALAERTGMTVAAVEDHARACCTDLVLHPAAWRVAARAAPAPGSRHREPGDARALDRAALRPGRRCSTPS